MTRRTAKSREEYVAAWQAHAREFVHVALTCNYDYDKWLALRAELFAMIESAADADFPKPTEEERDAREELG
jgi:hypothetical protein